jgi:hypothetical protein
MRTTPKKIVSGAAACAIAAGTLAALLAPSPASAAGANAGAADIVNPAGGAPLSSGGSATNFRLKLPTGAACTGDSPNAGYRIQSYLVPQSVDPGTLQFDSVGPVPVAGQYRSALIGSDANPYVDQQTAAAVPAGGPGPIIQPLPSFNYAEFAPPFGTYIPAGVYNIGIACTLGAPSTTQQDRYWNTVITVTSNPADSPGQITWAFGAVPTAPVLTSVQPGNGQLTASYTASASTPATTSYTVTASPPSGPAVTATSASPTSTTVTGLTNGTAYSVTVTATNGTGTSGASNAITATPAQANHPPVQNLTATPGTGKVNLAWLAPADAGTDPPTGYSVTVDPAGGTTAVSGTTAEVTGLAAGTVYTFTVVATYATAPGGTPAMVSATPFASQVLSQAITVTRPVGALVFTQVCGRNGALAADTSATPGFPSGSLPAVAATSPGAGTAPVFGAGTDPLFPQYPYPENADGTPAPNYPTSCGVALGDAKLVKKGAGGGQFFAASGVLNQVTVVDTRDTDIGWSANGTMGAFTAGPGKSFSGSQLGWSPVATSNTAAFTDSDGNVYDQTTAPGPVVLPNTPNASGLSGGRALGTAPANAGLGIAEFDARLKLLIPVTAKSGAYTGVLTISAI